MDTNVCFVFLLAIGLSAQMPVRSAKSEFQIDFEDLVGKVKLEDGKGTLLDCTENCDDVKETACKCVHFDHCMNSTVLNCISTGLQRFNLVSSEDVLLRLTEIPDLHNIIQADQHQWHTLVSPRRFLEYIQEEYQKFNMQKNYRYV
ncbi:hypothetical protein R3I93_012990 [Phoxinus phoxinus]|uniref:Uncharacterized protein n=1 Tax=Phoxinus phoxinus TaxID=58324 RepID=A0AAN9CUR9_9TELE